MSYKGIQFFWDKNGLHFKSFPFITGVYPLSHPPEGMPTYLPLEITFDTPSGIIHQKISSSTIQILNQAYRIGSMLSTPLGFGNINAPLFQEILDLLHEVNRGISGRSFLEPGCGPGHLLLQLHKKGATKVIGCEPGQQGQALAKEYGVYIHQDIFRSEDFSTDFDCVFHYGVLEHVLEPEAFLKDNAKCLRTNGVLLAIVPGCEEDLEMGNISMLAHEHLSYFTEASLIELFKKTGLEKVGSRRLNFSHGILAVWGFKPASSQSARSLPSEAFLQMEMRRFEHFGKKLNNVINCLQNRASILNQDNRSLGLYGVPSPLAGLINFGKRLRCFDGDNTKFGFTFSGFQGSIEDPLNLIKNPVEELWILPIYHDSAIRNFLAKLLPSGHKVEIFSLRSLIT